MYQFKMPSNLVQRGQPVPQFPGMQQMPATPAMPRMAAAPQAPAVPQAPSLNDLMAYYNPQAMAPQAPTAPMAPQAPRLPSLESMGPMGMGMPGYGSMPQSSGPSFFTL